MTASSIEHENRKHRFPVLLLFALIRTPKNHRIEIIGKCRDPNFISQLEGRIQNIRATLKLYARIIVDTAMRTYAGKSAIRSPENAP